MQFICLVGRLSRSEFQEKRHQRGASRPGAQARNAQLLATLACMLWHRRQWRWRNGGRWGCCGCCGGCCWCWCWFCCVFVLLFARRTIGDLRQEQVCLWLLIQVATVALLLVRQLRLASLQAYKLFDDRVGHCVAVARRCHDHTNLARPQGNYR